MTILKNISPFDQKCKLPYCKNCGVAYIILIIMAVSIMVYFFYLQKKFSIGNVANNDILNYKIFNFPLLENCCSMWPLSHFILFFILGMLFPDCEFPLIMAGVFWELYEMAWSRLQNDERQSVREKSGNVEYSKNWWAGSFKDIIMNSIGFYIGRYIIINSGYKFCIPYINKKTDWCN